MRGAVFTDMDRTPEITEYGPAKDRRTPKDTAAALAANAKSVLSSGDTRLSLAICGMIVIAAFFAVYAMFCAVDSLVLFIADVQRTGIAADIAVEAAAVLLSVTGVIPLLYGRTALVSALADGKADRADIRALFLPFSSARMFGRAYRDSAVLSVELFSGFFAADCLIGSMSYEGGEAAAMLIAAGASAAVFVPLFITALFRSRYVRFLLVSDASLRRRAAAAAVKSASKDPAFRSRRREIRKKQAGMTALSVAALFIPYLIHVKPLILIETALESADISRLSKENPAK